MFVSKQIQNIFGFVFLLLHIPTTSSTGTRLNQDEMEKHCKLGKIECFFKCLDNSECLSFAVQVNETCAGTWCILYSDSWINPNRFFEDSNSTYYFMESSCCNSTCLNGALCRSKACSCACKQGYTSTNCICPTSNVSRNFSHQWKIVKESSQITQIDSGSTQTWATILANNYILTLQSGSLVRMDGGLTYVSVGQSGVWGVNERKEIFRREGMTTSKPYGTRWQIQPGTLVQIDSGSSGVVYGVNRINNIFCWSNNVKWILVPGKFKHVSCGDYGCWAIMTDNSVAFRTGVTPVDCKGTAWVSVDGSFVQLDAGYQGRLYAVSLDNSLYYRAGICALHPTGSRWKQIKGLQVTHVTVGQNSLFAIAKNGTIFTST